jgi:hypothetical protein
LSLAHTASRVAGSCTSPLIVMAMALLLDRPALYQSSRS